MRISDWSSDVCSSDLDWPLGLSALSPRGERICRLASLLASRSGRGESGPLIGARVSPSYASSFGTSSATLSPEGERAGVARRSAYHAPRPLLAPARCDDLHFG